MALTQTRSGSRNASHRTNSLAFAKHDCHTCVALKTECDRQRPRCGTCLSSQRECDGFAMPLVWKDLEIAQNLSPKADKRRGQPRKRESQGNAEFKFIPGRPRKKRKPKLDNKGEEISNQGCFPAQVMHPGPIVQDSLTTWIEPTQDETNTSYVELENSYDELPATTVLNNWSDSPESIELVTGSDNTWMPSEQENLLSHVIQHGTGPFSTSYSDLTEFRVVRTTEPCVFEQQFHLSPMILYEDLTQKYNNVLEMYNDDFCVIPLSHDCDTNPFRVNVNFLQDYQFLLHAVMALSSQHLAKIDKSAVMISEMNTHRSAALHLFRDALSSSDFQPILDTLLILINFEITQSAYGMWSVHLNGARELLEQVSAGERIKENSRMRAQVAMLVWWDVTIAFISRREPLLPMNYLDTLVEFEENDGWSFFALNACPVEFVVTMAQLAKLASIYDKTTRMEWTIFNDLPVRMVVEDVKSFINIEAVNFDDMESLEDNAGARLNRFHCIEAWRHAILLYALRVFKQTQDDYQIRKIQHLARIILDGVRCIPQTEVIQKQLLLPVFLAGSEAETEWERSFVRQYCKHWSEVSRFYHFQSVAELLEDIWKDWNVFERESYWWGQKIGVKSGDMKEGRAPALVSEILLG